VDTEQERVAAHYTAMAQQREEREAAEARAEQEARRKAAVAR